MFFDEATGSVLTSDEAKERRTKNEQSHVDNEKGMSFEREGKFEQAAEEFNKAYQKCSKEYKDEKLFKENKMKSINKWANQLNQEGNSLVVAEKFEEAAEKYRQALSKTSNEEDRKTFQSNLDRALEKFEDLKLDADQTEAKDLLSEGLRNEFL
jgi:tetratricopeptide (TPR) repeat protein